MKQTWPKIFPIFFLLSFTQTQSHEILERSLQLGDHMRVTWRVNGSHINFLIEGSTLGFLGFGINPVGSMKGLDCVIGGIDDNGVPYLTDRFARGNGEPEIDKHQDWVLLSAHENQTHTTLNLTRALDTCDPEDVRITNDTTKLVWAMGLTDEVTYHGDLRGVVSINLLDPPPPILDTSEFRTWNITANTRIPSRSTIYWCTVHTTPRLDRKHQIVGFRVKLENDGARRHGHHLVVRKCDDGQEISKYLKQFVGKPGGECEDPDVPGVHQLMQLCPTYYYTWAQGGDELFFPQNSGISVGPAQEYFLLEVHYDNPHKRGGVSAEMTVQLFMTEHIREADVGLLTVSHSPSMALLIPPLAPNFMISGHCSARCTKKKIPPSGIHVFNVQLHAHLSGRQLKLRHFRPTPNGQWEELPWIYDANYDIQYQQNRPLQEMMTILPGDHLTFECSYNTSWRDPPSVTVGGLSTRNEMCAAFLTYYPKIVNFDLCASIYPAERLQTKFGVEEFDLKSDPRDPVILKPEWMAHKNWTTILNTVVDWTNPLKNQVEGMMRTDHLEQCIGYHDDEMTSYNEYFSDELITISYPHDFKEFVPLDHCQNNYYM